MSDCPVCAEEARSGPLPGLEACGGCGLAFKTERYFGEPVYEEGLEAGIYGAAKAGLFARALERLERALPAKGRLLDIGCATGEFLKAAAARGWKAEGVELNPALALKAEAAGFEVSPLPVEQAMLDKSAYDAVTVFEVFCLMDKPAAAAAELFKIMKPGGMLYVREFNAAFHLPLARLEAAGMFAPLGLKPAVLHNFNFKPRTLKAMLEAAGFTEVRIRNSEPTAGDAYRTGGRLGGLFTRLAKVLYYTLAQALWYASFGAAFAGSSLIVTARKQ
jgi:2-polyprenyl-3-methyl-5-hydroxy-6-metoxy-1,4-benzoquinol methylase